MNRPRGYVCHLCGQQVRQRLGESALASGHDGRARAVREILAILPQYGSASLLIHVEKCEEKWVAREETKLPKERRPVPPRPAELSAPLPTKPADVDAFNEAMSRHFNDVSLIRCPGCNRTFNEEALEKHRKCVLQCTCCAPTCVLSTKLRDLRTLPGPVASQGVHGRRGGQGSFPGWRRPVQPWRLRQGSQSLHVLLLRLSVHGRVADDPHRAMRGEEEAGGRRQAPQRAPTAAAKAGRVRPAAAVEGEHCRGRLPCDRQASADVAFSSMGQGHSLRAIYNSI